MWLTIDHQNEPSPAAAAVPLDEGELIVGRGPDCNLIIRQRRVSRRHVRLVRSGDKVTFKDLGSSTGTFHNGKKTGAGPLRPGEALTVGSTVLRLASQPPPEVDIDESPIRSSPASRPSPFSDWQPFRAFLDRLRDASDPKTLLESLLLGLVDIFKAERGFVLLRQRPKEDLVPVASHSLSNPDEFISISRTVYERALNTKGAVYIEDTMSDPWYLTHCKESLLNQSRSIVCAPLGSKGRSFGVIYVDAERDALAFDGEKLPVLESVTSLASEFLATAQTRRNLLAVRDRLQALESLAWESEHLVLGESPASQKLRELIEAAAARDVTVLITGETGTGKEMVARALHRLSPRRHGPFVAIHCAAIPREIIEAELFGAEKGAYTGSIEQRTGRFELAAGGTLFLDEIGELPLDFQVKLLRVLQERTVTRLGGTQTIPLDIRLVCATNRKLEDAVRQGDFRQDFYYRINVFNIEIKPLRERKADLKPLTDYFLRLHSTRFAGKFKPLSPVAATLIERYDWPGNVRELQNAIERALVVERSDMIQPESLPIAPAAPTDDAEGELFWGSLPGDYDAALEAFERGFLQRTLQRHEGNISAVAREYGKTRNAIYRRLRKLGLVK